MNLHDHDTFHTIMKQQSAHPATAMYKKLLLMKTAPLDLGEGFGPFVRFWLFFFFEVLLVFLVRLRNK